jgi:hypothetical protein
VLVRLASGHEVELERPELSRLLACGGTVPGLVQAVWAHPDRTLDVRGVLAAGPNDAFLIAEWALKAFLADDDDAAELGGVCQVYGQAPSDRLGISNPVLAFTLDQGCVAAMSRVAERAKEEASFNQVPRQGAVNDAG